MSRHPYVITKYGRNAWAIHDSAGGLVCITVYLRGAKAIVSRLQTYADALRGAVDSLQYAADALQTPQQCEMRQRIAEALALLSPDPEPAAGAERGPP